MKNKLSDLNDHLFAQLERLGDEELNGEQLEKEIERSRAITKVSKIVVDNAALVLRAEEFKAEHMGFNANDLPAMLESKPKQI